MAKHGLVVQDADGSVYFLRPEILEAAKVPNDLHTHVHGAVKAGQGAGNAKVLGSVDPEAQELSKTGQPKQMVSNVKTGDTIMCPW